MAWQKMIHRQLPLPEGGNVFCFGPRPTTVEIREVPQWLSDEDLKAFLNSLCSTPTGLMLGQGEGYRGSFYSINYVVLCREAEKAGVPVPVIPERPEGGAA